MLVVNLLAQAAAAVAAPALAAPAEGVISYPPAFFAAQQPSTALDMLNRIPGFSVDIGASVRGFEGAAGNVLIDGKRPASKTDNLAEILTRIPAGQVERIDVIRGGAPGIDMQGKTVLANVVRKSGGGLRGLVALSDLYLFDSRHLVGGRLEASGERGERKWEVSLRAARGLDDGAGHGRGARIFADGSPPVVATIASEDDGLQYTAAGSYEAPLLGGRLRVNGRLFTDELKGDDDYRIVSPAPALETTDYVQQTDESEIGGRYNRALAAGTDLELVGLRQTRDRVFTSEFSDGDTSRFVLDRATTETIGRAVLRRSFGEGLSVEAGGETALNTLDGATRFALNGTPIPLPAAEVQVEELRSEAFAKATWRPHAAWTVDGGLRYESSTITSEGDVVLEKTLHFLKPRLALTWAPAASTQVRLRVEREVGQLRFDDFVASGNLNTAGGVSAGNPDLDPEQAWVAEVAFEQRFWRAGVAVLSARHARLSDVVDRGPVFLDGAVFDRPTNIGDGTKDEISLALTVPLARLGLAGAQFKGEITKRWSEVTDPTTGETRRISGQHPLDWNVGFNQDIPRWNVSWGFDVFGNFSETYYRFNQVEVFKLQTYVKPFIEWRPRPGFSVRLEGSNLTRRDLRDTFYVFPGPRSAGGRPDIDDRYITDTPHGVAIRLRKNLG